MSPDSPLLMLQPLEGLEFDPRTHRYKYKGRWLHTSPTGVLSIDLDRAAKQRIEETKNVWEPRGNHCHLWLEHFLTGAAQIDSGEYKEWIDPLRNCWLWEGCTVLASELRLVDEKRNMAGSVDFIIRTREGHVTIGDLKTVGSIEAMNRRKPADAQLGAYIRMMNVCYGHVFIEKAVTVVAAPGQTKVIPSDVNTCSCAWEDAYDKYKMHGKLLGF